MFWDFKLLQNQRAFSIDNSIIARLQKNEPMNFPNFPEFYPNSLNGVSFKIRANVDRQLYCNIHFEKKERAQPDEK